MSGFAGLLHLDGGPVDPAPLERMAERLAYRAPDGIRTWHGGSIALVHGQLRVAPEEVGETQPIGEPEGDIRLAAHLRIDNRNDLLARLRRRSPALGEEASDARLLLAAYLQDGLGCCEEVLGDFAFALWHGERRRLVLARDAMGICQLYYASHGATIVFGSTIGAVLAGLEERPELNRDLIEAFLQGSYRPWVGETIHRGVLRVPPGSVLTADREGVRVRTWWRLGSTFSGGFSSDEQWIERFRELFGEAVRCRLRTDAPVGVMAGGGLDSAAIACTAHAALGTAAAREMRLFALTFEDPQADERGYLEALAGGLRGVEAVRLPADRLALSVGLLEGDDQPLEEPEVYLVRSHTAALFSSAARAGCRVVLSGEGANQVLGQRFYQDPRALAILGWRDLLAELPHFRTACGMGSVELLARGYLWSLVPAPLRRRLRGLRAGAGKRWVRRAGPGSWRRRLPPPLRPPAVPLSRAGRWAAQSIWRPFDLARYSALDVTAAHAGVELRLPFLDRRLVDFLVHLPPRLRSWRGEERVLLRRSMVDRMPEMIRRRRSRSHLAGVVDRLLKGEQRPAVADLLDNSRAVRLNFTDRVPPSERLEYHRKGVADLAEVLPFLYLEAWLRKTPWRLISK